MGTAWCMGSHLPSLNPSPSPHPSFYISPIHFSEDVVLWLWRTHNSVNKRLAGDASEDPKFPKRQFPPSFLCIECQSSGVYNEQRVLDFMLRYYTDIHAEGVQVSVTFS